MTLRRPTILLSGPLVSRLCLVAVLLSGCATQQGIELPPMNDWESRRQILGETDRFEFHGRIGVRAGDEGFNGKFWWWQRDADFRATIGGPLSIGTVRIAGYRNEFTLTDKDGTVVTIEDAEADLQARYGWTLPVDSLRYWALGIPDPDNPAETQFGSDGLLSSLVQLDWRVEISQYRDASGQVMPRRLTAVRDDTKVVLVIDDWSFF
jgi:outer membrane lipoprotein LolB